MGDSPLYRVRASGLGGSGYARPPVDDEPFKIINNADGIKIQAVVDEQGKTVVVPGATTVLKAMGDGPGLTQWKIDQTAAYAVAHVDSLLNRTEEQGWGFLRYFHKRVPDLDDPIRTAHKGVLDDLAQLGTGIHKWIEVDLFENDFPPEIKNRETAEMIDAWNVFKFEHTIEPVTAEKTVWADDYGATFDHIMIIDGKLSLIDVKSSKKIGDSHKMQLSALRNTRRSFEKVDGTWEEFYIPEVEEFGFIKVRPDDYDNKGKFVPRHAEYHTITEAELDIHFEKFQACLTFIQANGKLKALGKEED